MLKIEESEVRGSVTMATLERAARALNYQLVHVLIPRKTLESLTRERAERHARKQIQRTGHSMALEHQRVDASDERAQVEALTQESMMMQ